MYHQPDTHHPHTAKPWREQTAVEKLFSKLEDGLAPSKRKKKKTSTGAKIKQGLAKLAVPKDDYDYREAKVYTTDMESKEVRKEKPVTREHYEREYTTMEKPTMMTREYTKMEKPITREYTTMEQPITREYKSSHESPEYERFAHSFDKAEENVIEREGKLERRIRYRSKEDYGPEIRVIERGEPAPFSIPSHVEVVRRIKDRSAELQMVLDKIAREQSLMREAELDYHDQMSLAKQEEKAANLAKDRLRELTRLVRDKSAECRHLIDEEREYERLRAQKREQAVEVENQRTKLMAEEALLKREIDARYDLAGEHRRAAKHAEDLKKARQLALRELDAAKSALSQTSYEVEVIGERAVPRARPVEIEVEAIPATLPELARIPTKQPVGEHRGRVISEELPKREKVQYDAAKAERVRERVEHIVISE
jgi:hypothetical protein